jgi:hypothetical protein
MKPTAKWNGQSKQSYNKHGFWSSHNLKKKMHSGRSKDRFILITAAYLGVV